MSLCRLTRASRVNFRSRLDMIEPAQQLDQSSFTCSILAHNRYSRARWQMEVDGTENILAGARITKADVVKRDPLTNLFRHARLISSSQTGLRGFAIIEQPEVALARFDGLKEAAYRIAQARHLRPSKRASATSGCSIIAKPR